MQGMRTLFLIGAIALLALPAVAMREPGTLARTYFVKAKPSMVQQFEAAYKRHIAWHRQQRDTWTWHTWQVETGEQFGQYVIRTPGHHWEDFDARGEFNAADEAHWVANVAQYVESVSSTIVAYRPDLSRWPEGEIPALASVFQFHLNYGGSQEFDYAIKKIYQAIEKSHWPGHYSLLSVVSGSEVPTSIVVIPHRNWAAMKAPEKPLWTMIEEVYGRQEAQRLRDLFAKTVHCERSFMVRFRSDLSYQPAEQ